MYRKAELINLSDTQHKVCSRCNLARTYVDKRGYEHWSRNPKTGELVCKSCYRILKNGGSEFVPNPMTVTLSNNALKRSKLHQAMLIHFHHLVEQEGALVTYKDFEHFRVDGIKHKMAHGTFRNHISDAVKDGDVKLYCHSGLAFYTLKGVKVRKSHKDTYTGGLTLGTKFTNQSNSVSIGQMQVTLGSYFREICPNFRSHFLYRLLRDLPLDTTSIHNIRFAFPVPHLHSILSSNSSLRSIPNNYGLKTRFTHESYTIDMVIQKTNNVAVTIGCSLNPVPLTPTGLDGFSSVLEMISTKLYDLVVDSLTPPTLPSLPSTYPIPSSPTSSIAIPILSGASQFSSPKSITIALPHYNSWTVKMWHLNTDSLARYSGKAFEIEYAGACQMVKRIYVKQMKDGKFLRVESQEYPNKAYCAIIDNLLQSRIGFEPRYY